MNNTTENCALWPDQSYRCDIVEAIQKVCPSLSIIGCLFVMFVIWLFRKHHVFVQRLIFALAFSALFQSSSYLIGNIHSRSSHTVCYIQAFMMQYFLWSTLSWVIVITINMIFIVKGIESKKYEVFYHAFAWFNALFWALIPFVGDNYGPAGIWCWIRKDATKLRFGLWYLPLLLVCIGLLSIYVYIFLRNRRAARLPRDTYTAEYEQLKKTYKKEVKPLLVYPLIYLILTIPIFVYRLYDAMNPNEPPKFALLMASVIFAPSVGSCNALAYAFYNKTIRELSLDKLSKACNSKITGKGFTIRRDYEVDDVEASPCSKPASSVSGRNTLEFQNNVFLQSHRDSSS